VEIQESTLMEDDSRRDTRGRRRIGRVERQRYLEEFDRSGLTQRAFAKQEGLNYYTFISWLHGRRREQAGESTCGDALFQEVQVGLPGGSFAQRPSTGALEAVLPSGLVVRGADPRDVAELVRLLAR
jgi:hypothetical protein